MTNLEGRLIRLETLLQQFEDRRRRDRDNAAIAAQALRVNQQAGYGGGGGGSGVVFVAVTGAGGIPQASARPDASGTPGSATGLSVWAIVGGTYYQVANASATVYNPYLSATAAAVKVVTVAPNGDGTYTLLGESCT